MGASGTMWPLVVAWALIATVPALVLVMLGRSRPARTSFYCDVSGHDEEMKGTLEVQ